ncbi:MAG: hypothetical protein J5780_05415 [Treponema sp.]|nr:hypothetical protein [Treponema sp.]
MKFSKFLLIFAVVFSLAGCKSSESNLPPLEPLSLLSSDLSIYIHVPVEHHKELTARLLSAEVPSISAEDALALASRIKHLYAGLGTVKDRSYLEMSSDIDIPSIAKKKVFSSKNGWKTSDYNSPVPEPVVPANFSVHSRSDMDFRLSFASDDVLAVSKEIDPMLDKAALRETVSDTPYNAWINRDTKDILFYITRSGQYLNALIGARVTVNSDYVYGSIKYRPDPKRPGVYSELYDLTFSVHLKDKRTVQAFKSMLSLSFGLMGSEITQPEECTLTVSGVEVSAKQIENLFTRDPITGKHYRVEGDRIITEQVKKK